MADDVGAAVVDGTGSGTGVVLVLDSADGVADGLALGVLDPRGVGVGVGSC